MPKVDFGYLAKNIPSRPGGGFRRASAEEREAKRQRKVIRKAKKKATKDVYEDAFEATPTGLVGEEGVPFKDEAGEVFADVEGAPEFKGEKTGTIFDRNEFERTLYDMGEIELADAAQQSRYNAVAATRTHQLNEMGFKLKSAGRISQLLKRGSQANIALANEIGRIVDPDLDHYEQDRQGNWVEVDKDGTVNEVNMAQLERANTGFDTLYAQDTQTLRALIGGKAKDTKETTENVMASLMRKMQSGTPLDENDIKAIKLDMLSNPMNAMMAQALGPRYEPMMEEFMQKLKDGTVIPGELTPSIPSKPSTAPSDVLTRLRKALPGTVIEEGGYLYKLDSKGNVRRKKASK